MLGTKEMLKPALRMEYLCHTCVDIRAIPTSHDGDRIETLECSTPLNSVHAEAQLRALIPKPVDAYLHERMNVTYSSVMAMEACVDFVNFTPMGNPIHADAGAHMGRVVSWCRYCMPGLPTPQPRATWVGAVNMFLDSVDVPYYIETKSRNSQSVGNVEYEIW